MKLLKIKRFKDISLMGKFFTPQIASILLIISIGMLLSVDYKKVINEIDNASKVSAVYTELQDALLYTANGHADMMRTVSWAQSGQLKSQLEEAEKESLSNLATAKAGFTRIKNSNEEITSKNIDSIIESFDEYYSYVVDVLKNAKSDTFFASMQMKIAHTEYKKLEGKSSQLLATIVQTNKDSNKQVNISMNNAMFKFISIAIFAIISLTTLAIIVARAVSKPTKALTDVMSEMSKGNKKLDIPGANRGDELGSMAVAVEGFRDSLIAADEQEAQAAKERKEKELQAKRLVETSDKFSNEVGKLLKGVDEAISQVQHISESMDKTVEGASSQSLAVSAATEESNANVNAVASAAQEMDKAIQEITEQVAKQSNVAGIASDNMKTADQHMHTLNESVEKINEIVTLISSIADQTNLLALNATIEAARAGDAGKGFAVVASEVKGLATQTSKATEDIANQIKDVIDQTNEAVEAIETVNVRIVELTELSTTVAGAVEEQSAATNEITNNINQAASGSREVSENIQGVSTAMSEISVSSKKVGEARDALAKQSDNLSDRIKTFLKEVSS